MCVCVCACMCVCLFFCPASIRLRLCTHDVCACVRVCSQLLLANECARPWCAQRRSMVCGASELEAMVRATPPHGLWRIRTGTCAARTRLNQELKQKPMSLGVIVCVRACARMCRACFRLANCAGGAGVDVGWCSLTPPHDRHASNCYIAVSCSSRMEAPDVPAQGVSRHMAREQDTLPQLGHAMPRQSGNRLLL